MGVRTNQLSNKLKRNLLTVSLTKFVLWPWTRKTSSYIFVATTGRSGTASLTRIFSRIDSTRSFHEAWPRMNGSVMQAMNNLDTALARDEYRFIKSLAVRRAAIGCKYYFESNHMFIKSFADFSLQDFGEKLRVIHLVRNPVYVAVSITMLEHCPGSTKGNEWYLDYKAPGNLIKIADVLENDSRFSHSFYKSLWYWYEIESRIEKWKGENRQVPFFQLQTKDLDDENVLQGLLKKMSIKSNGTKLIKDRDARVNLKSMEKKKAFEWDDNVAMMHQDFKTMLIRKGYSLPKSASLFE